MEGALPGARSRALAGRLSGRVRHAFPGAVLTGAVLLALLAAEARTAPPAASPADALEQALATAEASLRAGRTGEAEARYRAAVALGWLLLADVDALDGRRADARRALETAAGAGSDEPRVQAALALARSRLGTPDEAVAALRALVAREPGDLALLRALAQALGTAGQPDEAVRVLEEARARAPADLELAYALAAAHLRHRNAAAAERLVAEIVAARPIPETHLLVGRTYLDAGEPARAQEHLRRALEMDPRARRAHYYLGLAIVAAHGTERLDDAIAEFRAAVEAEPEDAAARLQLGMALVEARRPEEAFPHLEAAAAGALDPRAHYYLGRAQLALDRPAEAVASLERALERARAQGANASALRAIHVQLGPALRRIGRTEDAEKSFAESAKLTAEMAGAERESLARYLSDVASPSDDSPAAAGGLEASPLAALPASEREALGGRVRSGLARAHFNLGVMKAQAGEPAAALDELERVSELEPSFPGLFFALGVSAFNARSYAKAASALERALADKGEDPRLKRMLGLASLETGQYARAAELLGADPEVGSDPSLQFAYGLALVRSGRATEAERVLSRLLAQSGETDLAVMARHHLATALEMQGRLEEAVPLLREVVAAKPELGSARYLLGKVLLAQGRAEEARGHLEEAARLDPEAADVAYQLGKAYHELGRAEDARRAFERFRTLQDKKR